jgi:hypothetical protein
MEKLALVFCYLDIIKLAPHIDINEWKNVFTKQAISTFEIHNIKTNIILDIDNQHDIHIKLADNCFGYTMENYNLALEIEISSNTLNSTQLKEHLYLIKPLIIKMINNINNCMKYIDIANIPQDDFILYKDKFYTEVNTNSNQKCISITEADLHFLYDIEDIVKLL